MIGTQIDKYEVLQKIGEGGMATVYRGRHATLDRDVAIKVLHPHLSSSTRNRKRFAREARAIEHLKHENILEIYDYSGVDQSDCYIVTELVRGETLSELLSRCGKVPSEVATLIGLSLCAALGYAHSQGVLHRDLKPENVMIRQDGRVKLMDFGIARFLDESQVTMTGALVGSPAFMSPEQAREAPLDARSDLFSLGTVLFLLVTGELPFSGTNPSLVLKNIIEGNRPQASELEPSMSATLADVIERLLSVHREDRPRDAAEVAAALQVALDEIGWTAPVLAADPRWTVERFLADPEAWQADLDAWLPDTLLRAGRERLAAGDTLAGLRLVNRLLSLRGDHADAMALLREFHGLEGDRKPDRRRGVLAGMVAVVAVAAAGAWWWRVGAQVAEVTPREEPASTAVVAIPEPPVLQAPVPAAEPAPEPVAAPPEPALPEPASPAAVGSPNRVAVDARPVARRKPTPVVPIIEPEPAAAAEAAACVGLRSREAPADIWLDGKRIGTTRDSGCYSIPPGTYSFTLRAPTVEERTVRLTLEPGEVRDPELVKLTRLPARVRFATTLASTCVVSVDGLARGTLGDLKYGVSVSHPERRHEVALQCGQKRETVTYAELAYLEVWFDGAGRP